jgi:hypothetical protein
MHLDPAAVDRIAELCVYPAGKIAGRLSVESCAEAARCGFNGDETAAILLFCVDLSKHLRRRSW